MVLGERVIVAPFPPSYDRVGPRRALGLYRFTLGLGPTAPAAWLGGVNYALGMVLDLAGVDNGNRYEWLSTPSTPSQQAGRFIDVYGNAIANTTAARAQTFFTIMPRGTSTRSPISIFIGCRYVLVRDEWIIHDLPGPPRLRVLSRSRAAECRVLCGIAPGDVVAGHGTTAAIANLGVNVPVATATIFCPRGVATSAPPVATGIIALGGGVPVATATLVAAAAIAVATAAIAAAATDASVIIGARRCFFCVNHHWHCAPVARIAARCGQRALAAVLVWDDARKFRLPGRDLWGDYPRPYHRRRGPRDVGMLATATPPQ